METFSALLALCAGNSPVTGEFPSQKPVTRSFDGFFDLRLNERLSKQSLGWWFATPSRSLWCYCNDICRNDTIFKTKSIKTLLDLHNINTYFTRSLFLCAENQHAAGLYLFMYALDDTEWDHDDRRCTVV